VRIWLGKVLYEKEKAKSDTQIVTSLNPPRSQVKISQCTYSGVKHAVAPGFLYCCRCDYYNSMKIQPSKGPNYKTLPFTIISAKA